MPEYPERPHIGVGALVVKNGDILLVKRKYPPKKGYWSVPGGHMKLGERICEAAVRELEEETGLKSEPLGIVNLDELIIYDDVGKVRYHYVLIDVLMSVIGGKLVAGSDAEEVRYFSLEDVSRMKNVTDSTRRLALKILNNEISLNEPFRPVLTSYKC